MRVPSVLLILAFNLAPVFGAVFFDWQPFQAFWFFWLETLIIAFFNAVRIAFSRGGNTSAHQRYHFSKALNYLVIRFFVFLFYSVFIITFIGFVANKNGDKMTVLTTLFFRNTYFNLGLLISIVSQTWYLLFYFRSGEYLRNDPNGYASLFDSRQIIVHVAVIFGTFAAAFVTNETAFGRYSSIAVIAVFCVCKCVGDLFNNTFRPIKNTPLSDQGLHQ